MRKFESLDVETNLSALRDSLTSLQVRVDNDKAELVDLELKELKDQVEELRGQAKPQPSEATSEFMRELEQKVLASTAKSLKLENAFDVVKLQASSNVGLNDERFKEIEDKLMKGSDRREKGRIVDRKTFHSSISKFSGAEGEPEIRGFAFQLRQFLSKDDNYIDMMAWLEGIDGEFTPELVKEKRSEVKDWEFDEMDQQFYQILVATAVPKSTAAHKLMALEKRKDVPRGMMAYNDFTRELLGSTASTRTMIANRVRNPAPITSMDDIEVRLLQWEADLEQFEIYEPNKLGETIKMGILKDMVPETVRQVIRQQKPSTLDKLKQVLKDEAKEHRDVMNAKKLRSKGLHVAEGERWAPRPEDSPNDQLDDPLFAWNEQLNFFVPASAEADEQTFAWDTNL